MPDRPVVLVSDRPERADRLARGIGLVLPCRLFAPRGALPVVEPLAWVFDFDLDKVSNTPWFDSLCARIEPDKACVFLSRESGVRDPADFARLGNPTVVSARLNANGVVTMLVKAIDRARLLAARNPVERNLGAATGIVSNLFTAAALGQDPSPLDADEGTEIVLHAVADIGIRAWLDLLWRHDITVYEHSLSVAGFAAAFATELGFTRGDRHRLAKAALLHDVGKSRIPLAILNKPGPLTPDETETMRSHSGIGANLLAATGRFEDEVIDVARSHHERLDGSGYPDGLTGDAISDLTRLVAICDVHSALTERRVYRAPIPPAQARAIMEGMSGQLDPDLLRAYRPVLALCEAASAMVRS